jgi:DNA modification methylase
MSDPKAFIRAGACLKQQDALAGMAELPAQSFDLAIADPPYGASTTATWKLDHGHSLAGLGGAWKLAAHSWDQLCNLEGFEGTIAFLSELKRLDMDSRNLSQRGRRQCRLPDSRTRDYQRSRLVQAKRISQLVRPAPDGEP